MKRKHAKKEPNTAISVLYINENDELVVQYQPANFKPELLSEYELIKIDYRWLFCIGFIKRIGKSTVAIQPLQLEVRDDNLY